MIGCEQYHEIIMIHLDGDLGEEQQKALQQHLSMCPDCSRLLTQLDSLVSELRDTTAPEPWPELEKMVMSRIMDEPEIIEQDLSAFMRISLVTLTAALLFLLGVFISGIDIAELAIWGGNLTEALSVTLVDIQVVYHILADLFPFELFSVISGIQLILVASMCFTAVAVLKTVFGETGKTIGIP